MPKMRYVILALTLLFFVLGSVRFLPAKAQTGDWTTYQDNHPLILASMVGTWQTTIDSYADGNSLTTNAGGGTLVIEFEGTGIEIVYAQLPNSPVDGTFTGQLDEFEWGATSTYATTPTYGLLLRQTGLAFGVHTLTLTNVNGLLALDAIRIEGGLLTASSTPPDTPTPVAVIPTPIPTPEGIQSVASLSESPVIVQNTTELLAAIAAANTQPSNPVTIYLAEGEYVIPPDQFLKLYSPITLQGTGATGATLRREQNATSALVVVSGASVELHHLIIKQSNTSSRNYAGGIYNLGQLQLFDSRIESNQVLNGGAGIMNYGTLTIERTVFTDNYAGAGAAIQNEGGHLDINCSIFTNNLAHYGAGLLNARTTGSVVIRNSLFSGNVAEWPEFSGAGIYNLSSEVTVDAAHNEWVNNTPGDTAGATIITSPTKPFDTTACAPLPAPPLPAECPASFGIQEETTVLSPNCQPQPTPNLTPTSLPDRCIVKIPNGVKINAYTSPTPARTERIQFPAEIGPKASDYLPYETAVQTFNAGTQLWIEARYERDVVDDQKFIVEVYGYNTSPDDSDVFDENDPDWVKGLDLWINTYPAGTPRVVGVSTGGGCENLTSKSPVLNSRHNLIEQLRDYGVDVREYEVDGNGNPITTTKKEWIITELQAILEGVTATSNAFVNFSTRSPKPTATDAFRMVMNTPKDGNPASFWLTFVRTTTQRGYCKTDNNTKTVTCYGTIYLLPNNTQTQVTRYAVVHELGHVFDNQSATGNNTPLRTYISDTAKIVIADNRNGTGLGIVMGNFPCIQTGKRAWRRGERGWGSGPGSNYSSVNINGVVGPDDVCGEPLQAHTTPYQQNAAPYTGGANEHEETAADMFLNWVYSAFLDNSWKPRDIVPNSNPPVSCHSVGCPEATLGTGGTPGAARLDWMNSTQLISGTNEPKGVMRQIFKKHGW